MWLIVLPEELIKQALPFQSMTGEFSPVGIVVDAAIVVENTN